MNSSATIRDEATERRERLRFVLLQHLLSLGGEEEALQMPSALAAALAISESELLEILRGLHERAMVSWSRETGPIQLTRPGEDYVLQHARRRKTVRDPLYAWRGKPRRPDGSPVPPG